ncbi:glycosyl transferase family group 2-domain-containing protein [Massariosphaeria phaeospora]|uniref:Glycosyl transferase family group 2-domain-containing protein n=1 Tax=Massariosphaeria phaeospora TaxID=100035 RepID=A0A7C8MAI8_9PLEO|nr:glycosyl transferase family group 2-domain-containing protein [Massariosphaeria phaeospora]
MPADNEKQVAGIEASTEQIQLLGNGTSTPKDGRRTPNFRRHPASALLEQMPSRRNSFTGSTHSSSNYSHMEEVKHEIMANHLFEKQCKKLWISELSGGLEGIVLRKRRGHYITYPPTLSYSSFAYYCSLMNIRVAMTVSSRIIQTLLHLSPRATDVPLKNGLRIQILSTMDDLPKARKNQFAAFLAVESLLVVWDDDPMNIVERATAIEDELVDLVWRAGETQEASSGEDKKKQPADGVEVDVESGDIKSDYRPVHLTNSVLVAFALCIIVIMLGAGVRQIAIGIMVDKQYARLAFLALVPIQIFFTLFFAQVIVGCIAQCVGPIRQMKTNSRFYSAHLPRRLMGPLPHITIQCPVYKEGLGSVIAPTIKSIRQAISTYELQGGTANMLVNDDGLQILDEEARHARIEFYTDHGIGWTARPKDGSDGFVRKGKFKKASNMNYGLMLSNIVENKLEGVERTGDWSHNDEVKEYERCLSETLEENGRAWADGNIRIGDYILLIDSDTRVPADCLLDAASEMEQSPEVGIMQFSSGVMQVVHTYFESGITFFTNLIYTAIRYTVSNGDVAPFVGHNAILRWSALQEVSFHDADGAEKFWSESHVSEDFDMSLRLQVHGYIIRLAAWAGDGFKEGVSLTVYDELARWEKYAYGCNELLFHPVRYWFVRGPFTDLFRRFLFSNIRFTSKVTILSYIGTYYAIGAAWIMTVANYFAVGWFNGYLDKYYIDSWKVWFSIVIAFTGLGNLALAILHYRTAHKPFLAALLENCKWILLLAIFLGGLSLHISQALLAHMFEVNMDWGATAKEAEFSNFFIEVPKVLRRFRFSFAFAGLGVVGMCVMAREGVVPVTWEIRDFVAVVPLAAVVGSHALLPIVLNPALMVFAF